MKLGPLPPPPLPGLGRPFIALSTAMGGPDKNELNPSKPYSIGDLLLVGFGCYLRYDSGDFISCHGGST